MLPYFFFIYRCWYFVHFVILFSLWTSVFISIVNILKETFSEITRSQVALGSIYLFRSAFLCSFSSFDSFHRPVQFSLYKKRCDKIKSSHGDKYVSMTRGTHAMYYIINDIRLKIQKFSERIAIATNKDERRWWENRKKQNHKKRIEYKATRGKERRNKNRTEWECNAIHNTITA